MKILLLSAYHAASHQRWVQGLQDYFTEADWTCLSLPPRFFSWRIRGNSLSWGFGQERFLLEQNYDLLIATSMVDLSALRGFVPNLARLPTLIYFHENQFVYPASGKQSSSVEPQVLSLYTALCGDRVVFNSEFNRATFFEGVRQLLRKLPDAVPKQLVDRLQARSNVVPVPLENRCFKSGTAGALTSDVPLQLIWNHRWEYDKGPELLLALIHQLEIPFQLHVVGQQFRHRPAVFDDIYKTLQARSALGQWGYMESRQAYQQLLQSCHGVISTALHDFQGLAVLEAVAAGCFPLVPARQAYPEWFGTAYCYRSCLDDTRAETASLRARTQDLYQSLLEDGVVPPPSALSAVEPPNLEAMSWERLGERYRAEFMALLDAA